MRNFTVTATYDGRWWVLILDELGWVSQARTRTEIRGQARDLAATGLGVRRNAVQVGRVTLKRVPWSRLLDP
jgi:predicted RNase H-like HicB family nuclease